MYCDGIGSDAEITVLFGAGPVLNIIDVSLSAGEHYISTQNREGATPAFIARDFADVETIKVDLMDDQASELLVSIRIVRSPYTDDEEPFQIGYLQIGENRPLGVTCAGP